MMVLPLAIEFIPGFQPIPLPLPVLMLEILLVAGFLLHLIPMNLALGGGFMAGIYGLIGHKTGNPHAQRFATHQTQLLPLLISFTITQGIVPLLFIQLLYGPLFYSSSILMAVPWLALLLVMGIGYYLSYTLIYKHEAFNAKSPLLSPLLSIGISLLFCLVAYLFTSNLQLMTQPQHWIKLYQASPVGLNVYYDPSIWPRLLHTLIAAIAVTGLGMGCFGLYWLKRDTDYGTWLLQKGSIIYASHTLMQFVFGSWYLMSLPRPQMKLFMGGDPISSVAFMGALVCMVISLLFAFLNYAKPTALKFFLSLIPGLLTVVGMVVMRHMLRMATVASFYATTVATVKPQWGTLAIFLTLTVGLIVYLIWLTGVVIKVIHQPEASPSVLS